MAVDWRRELGTLSSKIEYVMRHSQRDHYHHAVLHVGEDVTEECEITTPRVYAGGHRVARKYVLKLPNGGAHIHYFFDDNVDNSNHELLDVFIGLFSQVRRVLNALPNRIAPKFAVPPQQDGRWENSLAWLYLLHWLGSLSDNRVFRTHVEYLPSMSSLVCRDAFRPWETCPAIPEFDPVAVLTLSSRPGEGYHCWRTRHLTEDRELPPLIASSVSKPLFYASINAIAILDSLAKPTVHVKQKLRRDERLRRDVRSLLDVLIQRHCRNDENACKPWQLKDIEAELKWQQGKATRRMQALFPTYRGTKGFKAYEVRCCDQSIAEYLLDTFENEVVLRKPDVHKPDVEDDPESDYDD